MVVPIELRAKTYYAYLDVPKDVRGKLGRRIYRETLQTSDLKIAMRRMVPRISAWKAEIAQARGEPQADDAAYWRERLRRAKTPTQRQAIIHQIEMETWALGAANVDTGSSPSADPEAQRFYAVATGNLVETTAYLNEWIASIKTSPKTKDMQRADVNRLAAKFKFVTDITRPEMKRWTTSLMNDDGLTPKTVQRILSALRGYWRYLQSINAAAEDFEPFTKLDVARSNQRDAPRSKRRDFDPADVVRLWRAAQRRKDQPLADLIELDMWSGARIEELCSLKVPKVNLAKDYFDVDDAKTEAGWRRVPIHPKAKATWTRLVKESKDGYVLSGLTAIKYGDRSSAVGKRFGRMKKRMGHGAQFVFHSIRKTVATILENAHVPEGIAADIIGHDKPTLTFGLYSGGASLEAKREAIGKLHYPGIT